MSLGNSKVPNMQFQCYMITIMYALKLKPETCNLQIRHFPVLICAHKYAFGGGYITVYNFGALVLHTVDPVWFPYRGGEDPEVR